MIENRTHRAVAYPILISDAVGAGDHPRYQRSDLAASVGAFIGRHSQMLIGQIQQTGLFGQRHHRDQPGI